MVMTIFEQVLKLLIEGESHALAVILSQTGSTPRGVGSRMIIRADGSIIGTVGGGILEAQVQSLAREVLAKKGSAIRRFVLSAQDAAQIGMICGGEQNILVQYLDGGNTQAIDFYKELFATLKNRQLAWLLTRLPSETGNGIKLKQSLVRSDDSVVGELSYERSRFLIERFGAEKSKLVEDGKDRFLIEPLDREGTVIIFGAGHIGEKLAILTKFAGFRTLVLDDREEFANRERFASVDEVIVLDSFEQAFVKLDVDSDTYLVIVTRGHANDKTVLAQALRKGAGYIGMIGSRSKRDAVYADLERDGFFRRDLERIFSPIGLKIGAETPEEIALSIVSELVRERAAKIGRLKTGSGG